MRSRLSFLAHHYGLSSHIETMASSKTKNVNAVMGDVSNDITLPLGPRDTVSTVCWAPIHDYLAASSWDSKIYIYDVSVPQSAKGLAAIPTHAPVFDCDFNQVSPLRSDSTTPLASTTAIPVE